MRAQLQHYRWHVAIGGVVLLLLVVLATCNSNPNPDAATTAKVVEWAKTKELYLPPGQCGGFDCEIVKRYIQCATNPEKCPLGGSGSAPVTTGATITPTQTPTKPAPTATLQPPVRIQVTAPTVTGTVTATVTNTNTVTLAVVPEKVVDYGLGISALDRGQVQFLFAPEYSFAAQRLWFGRDCPLTYAPGCKNRELFLQIPEKGKTFLTMEGKDPVTGPNVLFKNDVVTYVAGRVFTDTNTIQIGEVVSTTMTASPEWITAVGRRYVGKNGPQTPAIVVANIKLQKADGFNAATIRDLWYIVPDGDNGEIAKSIPSLLPKPPVPPTPTPTATSTPTATRVGPTATKTKMPPTPTRTKTPKP